MNVDEAISVNERNESKDIYVEQEKNSE